MATTAERHALLFLLSLALVGAGVRTVSARRFERDVAAGLRVSGAGDSASDANPVDAQLAAVDSARGVRSSRASRAPRTRPRGTVETSVTDPASVSRSRSRVERPTLSRGEQRPPVGPVDVNRATAEQLETLPRIGPSLARRIVAYREQHGPFASVEDLRHVRGIGVTTAALVAPLVTFSGGYRPIPE